MGGVKPSIRERHHTDCLKLRKYHTIISKTKASKERIALLIINREKKLK